jgi:CHAD domain-containing protein
VLTAELGVKRLQDALGEVRDLQVRRAWLAAHKRGAALAQLIEHLDAGIPPRARDLRREIARWSHVTVPDLMQAASGLHEPGRLGGHRLREKLAARLAKLNDRLRAALASDDAASAHALRIAVKKARYDAELLAPALGKIASKLVKALTPLQETLGDLHDADVRLVWLEELAAGARSEERAAALALLDDVREERERLSSELVDRLSPWRKKHTARRHRRRLLH